jgi:hypothetical protein
MGQFVFHVPRPERLAPGAVERAYLASIDGIPWECKCQWDDGILTIERDTRESGNLYFCWNVSGRGQVMLCSGSLMERERPYNLPVELARGTINRLRNQAAAWQAAGMIIPPKFEELNSRAAITFAKAAIGQERPEQAAKHSEEAIRISLEAADLLVNDYAEQVLAIRRREQPTLTTLLAGRLDGVPQGAAADAFLAAFNTAVLVPNWPEMGSSSGECKWDELDQQVQWCRDNGLRICMGPLVQFDRGSLPDWLYLWEGEYDEICDSVFKFASGVVRRYVGKVHLWNCAGRMNVPGAMDLTEEQRLKLTVDMLEVVRSLDPRTPAIVSFDQPWAEYIAAQDQELTPLHFADTLGRSDLGMAGVGLEINLGYSPHGTLPRDLLEINRQIDRWSALGLPLVVFVTAPSSEAKDSLARSPAQALPSLIAGGVSPQAQAELISVLVPLLIARQPVQAVVWNQWRDDLPHDFPHGGLYDTMGQPKPGLKKLVEIRREYLS